MPALLLWCICSASAAEKPGEPILQDIILTTSDSHLLLFVTIENGATPELIESVKNGIPVTFEFLVELERIRSAWFDKNIANLSVTHKLTYDSLKQEYTVSFSEQNDREQRFKSVNKALAAMAELNGLKVIARKKLSPDSPYALRLQAKLSEVKLPLGIHTIIPFISLWNVETKWRTIEFRY